MITTADVTAQIATVCPKAPPGADPYVDDITGYVMWGVLALLFAAALVGIGAVVGGRMFSMPHASKVGIISIVVVFFAAIGYMIVPGIIAGITGSGCV